MSTPTVGRPMNGMREKVTYQQTDRGAIPVYADGLVSQPETYTDDEHAVWNTLFLRQRPLLEHKAYRVFLTCLDTCLSPQSIPRFDEVNSFLAQRTGWSVVGVNGLLSDAAFFGLLAQRMFPVTWWIRPRRNIDYIQEPDLFHDLFGHVPLLAHPPYANALLAFGRAGTMVQDNSQAMLSLARFYWHTIEFGLIEEPDGIKAFGAGLMSSPGEVEHALGHDAQRIAFRLATVLRTPYKIDAYQPTYFVLPSFEHVGLALTKFENSIRKDKHI